MALFRGFGTVGLLVWLFLAYIFLTDSVGLAVIEWLFMLAPLVIVPLGLGLVLVPGRDGRWGPVGRILRWLLPIGSLCLVGSLILPVGTWAGLLAIPWVLVGVLSGLVGLSRCLERGGRRMEEWAVDVALGYLPVGCAWLLSYRWGYPLLGYYPEVVLLTAVHFHFAGFGAAMVAGMTGRCVRQHGPSSSLALTTVIVVVMLGPPLVAAGILWSMWMEAICGVLLALGMLGLALWMLTAAVRWVQQRVSRVLLSVAALSLVVSMALAVLYALREWVSIEGLDIPTMARVHGVANAVGFSLAGMVAWSWVMPASWIPPRGIPWSRLAAGRRVGPDFFQRRDLLDPSGEPVTGLVDDMSAYDSPAFSAEVLHPAIREFYEKTDNAWLTVTPDWQPGFRLGGRLFVWFARRVGQLNLPLEPERPEEVASCIARVREDKDGRRGVRAWVRTTRRDGAAIYVAAYAQHQWAGVPYMNIAFPLPLGNMTSVLHLRAWAREQEGDGLILSTKTYEGSVPDAGVYWVSRFGAVRLPLNETIRIWHEPGDGSVRATHDMWFFRWRYLRLTYTVGAGVPPSVSESSEGTSGSGDSA